MALVSITNPTIQNSETADVTKLTQNDGDLLAGITDGTKDLKISQLYTNHIGETTGGHGVTIDNAMTASTISATSMSASGAEQLKIYTYKRTLDSTDNTNRYYVFTVTDVVSRANVRSITCVGVDSSDSSATYSYTIGDSAGLGMKAYMTSTTACRVDFGTTYTTSDQISITIIVAV